MRDTDEMLTVEAIAKRISSTPRSKHGEDLARAEEVGFELVEVVRLLWLEGDGGLGDVDQVDLVCNVEGKDFQLFGRHGFVEVGPDGW